MYLKKFLNRKQSKELIELGISSEYASMVSWKSKTDWQNKVVSDKEHFELKPFRPAVMGFERFDCQDIFTLSDLISILPQTITSEQTYKLNISIVGENKWCVSYNLNEFDSYFACVSEELIYAVMEALILLNK